MGKRRKILLLICILMLSQTFLMGAGFIDDGMPGLEIFDVELRNPKVKLLDLDEIIKDGGDGPEDVESPEVAEESEEETVVSEPTPTPTPLPSEKKDTTSQKHLKIVISYKDIYVNDIHIESVDALEGKINYFYVDGDYVDIVDDYGEFHVVRDVINCLKEKGIDKDRIRIESVQNE